MRKPRKNSLSLAFVMLLGGVGSSGSLLVPAAQASNSFYQTYGTYSELSARWWQWAFSIPAAGNPIVDPTGDNCGEGQVDDVWFLAGGVSVERNCTIPSGKPIFFPLINSVVFKPPGRNTLLDLRAMAAQFPDSASTLTCFIDGEACTFHRAKSPSFTVLAQPHGFLPPGILKAPGNTDPMVADGYWSLLDPLSVGSHILSFHVEDEGGNTLQDVTYNITVVKNEI